MVDVSKRRLRYRDICVRVLFIIVGALIVAAGLKLLIMPAQIIDGGIVGISLITSHLTELPLGLFLFIFNLPFVYIGYKQIGKVFALSTLFGIVVLSVGTILFANVDYLTTDPFLASIFGGAMVGFGIGLVIRNGGALDGTEVIAILLNKKTGMSVGQIILYINVFIFGAAAFVYGVENAMYSVVAYFIAFKVIDLVVEGVQDMKAMMIVSDDSESISDAIWDELGRGVTYLDGRGGRDLSGKKIIYVVVTRIEESVVRDIVHTADENAFVTIMNVADVHGGQFMKKDIH